MAGKIDKNYADLLNGLIDRICQARLRTALTVNLHHFIFLLGNWKYYSKTANSGRLGGEGN
jgi:hypothetical protein